VAPPVSAKLPRWPLLKRAKVVITGRREKEGADVAEEITKTGGTAAFVRADVAKDADVAKAIDFVVFSPYRGTR
jgi:NAD(P)-dependent dehydrogenase (short-subunit alcohol dehydrogenase family)